jgi:K+-transporting ATPase ATPase A chain
MTVTGWIQLAIFVACLLALTRPLGIYLLQVLDPGQAGRGTFLDPVLGPVERLIYRLLRVDPKKEHNWKQYAIAMLVFSAVSAVATYAILRLQANLPMHGRSVDLATSHPFPLTPDLSFNTAMSFTTNTNWQNYAGENTMSYFSQMVALASHNFFSAAVGISIAAALVRGLTRNRAGTVGNFWVDLVRIHLYVLLPICLIYAVFLVKQGMIQNFRPYTTANVVDASGGSSPQVIVQGPMASQMAIKMLGTNGGGYTNANASQPFENPTPLSNFFQMLSIFLIPTGLTYYLGRMAKNQAHGWAVWGAMFFLFIVGALACWASETAGNPRLSDLHVDPGTTAFEGKEVRFGLFNSALFATITTDASCGAVNCMHDSLTPLGGLVPMFNIHLGEVVFGGVGAGLYGMLVFVIIAIFIAGLMIGRTPEYLGKKIESYDVKAAMLTLLILTVIILGFTAWASYAPWGNSATGNAGPHGFSEMHYAYTSGAGNNGSAFAGLSGNTVPWNTTLAFDFLLGRFFMIIPIMALAGHMAAKTRAPQSDGSFPVGGMTFSLLLVGTVVIVGALTFLPALAMGPILEHFKMWGSTTLY